MKVTVKDFQSLKQTTVEVEGLTVLVGPSHRGKSAFLRAVEGALFNRPGDQFVRVGASKAVVVVEGLPTVAGGSLDLTWVKGKSVNDYIVNGTSYGRVGTGVPPPIVEAGYRDVWIGDKERKKGSYIRPQVATQFEPLFLLTQTGSFISDVLSVVSRHAVILTAQGRCGGDLKSTKQLLGVRRSDHRVETSRLDVLGEVPTLASRVAELEQEAAALARFRQRVERVRGLVAWRRACLALAGAEVPLPTEVHPVEEVRARVDAVARLTRRRPLLVHVVAHSLPAAVEVRADLGAAVLAARAPVMKRGLLLRASQAIPPTELDVVPEAIDRAVQSRAQVLRLVERRRRLLDAAARQLPPEWSATVSRLVPWQQKAETLNRLTGARIMHLTVLQRTEAAYRSAVVDVETIEADLDALMGSLAICPLCGQEMAHSCV